MTSFSSSEWLAYFEENKNNRAGIIINGEVKIQKELRAPLIRSLQRFQIGETGEGKHLRKFSKRMNDPHYEQCIDLFIKEEQSHARVLAEMIAALDGTLLTWHWTDIAFIILRRMLGLKTELLIILIAEIVGKCFYLQCARNVEDDRIRNAFSIIVLDEIAHLEFHCDFLRAQFGALPLHMRYIICWAWASIFFAACYVFVLDHKKTLAGLKTSPKEFIAQCTQSFNRAAAKSLLYDKSHASVVTLGS